MAIWNLAKFQREFFIAVFEHCTGLPERETNEIERTLDNHCASIEQLLRVYASFPADGSDAEIERVREILNHCSMFKPEDVVSAGEVVEELWYEAFERLEEIVSQRCGLAATPVPRTPAIKWKRVKRLIGVARRSQSVRTGAARPSSPTPQGAGAQRTSFASVAGQIIDSKRIARGVGALRSLAPQYWLEAIPPHLPWHDISPFYAIWNPSNPTGFANPEGVTYRHVAPVANPHFFTWVFEQRRTQELDDIVRRVATLGSGAMPDRLMITQWGNAERAAGRVVVEGGLLRNTQGRLFDSTFYGGTARPGWAIFVQDLDGSIYVNTPELMRFHHSSFLGNCPVRMAGAFCVLRGQLVAMDTKSGHYTPTIENLRSFLNFLHQRGALGPQVPVCLTPWIPGSLWFNAQNIRLATTSNLLDFGPPFVPHAQLVT